MVFLAIDSDTDSKTSSSIS